MIEEITKWINEFVSVHNETLNNTPCPYAKNALVRYVETDNIGEVLSETFNTWDDSAEVVCIYTATENYTPYDLHHLIMEFNNTVMAADLVALEDHPDSEEIINGVKMNFGKCILVLVQRLSTVNQASVALDAKGYYDNWSKENLDDVVSWRFDW
jgi:hypothetical protein